MFVQTRIRAIRQVLSLCLLISFIATCFPPPALAATPSISSVSGGGFHSIALATDGTVWTAGRNTYGQLGDGTTENRTVFVQVPQIRAIAIAGGGNHTIALKSDGTVWAWGMNELGQLGDGTSTNRATPVQVSGLSGITAIASKWNHNLALKNDGTVWAWGANENGQLGDGTTVSRSTPVQVSGLSGIVGIAGGVSHSIALQNDGTVWAWGLNAAGQLGDGTNTNRLNPVQVSGLSGITVIASGENHAIALKNDGSIWTWGGNGYGYLGDGTTTNRSVPVQVFGDVGAIAGGGLHTVVLKNGGSVWTWGNNQLGQLGDGTTSDRRTAVEVSGLNGIIAVSGGSLHTIALRSDGTVWTWGHNQFGQLGDGTDIHRSTPVQAQWLGSPEPSLTGISLDSTHYDLTKGTSHQTVVTAHYSDNSNRVVTGQSQYESSNPAAASVNATGLVYGEDPGQSTITVSYLGQTAAASVTVADPPTKGFLYGVILDTTTQAPAHGITLTFRKGLNVTDGPIAATVNSAFGDYGVTLPFGDYTAVITGDNYEPSMITATVNSQTQSKDGSITRKPESLNGFLYGVILDTTTQAPAHGITLTFRKGMNVTTGPVSATVTSANGDYGVTLPYGDYTAVITGDNYEPSTITATVNSQTQSQNGTITRKPESLNGFLYGVILDTMTQAPAHGITLTFRKGLNVTDGPIAATVASAFGDYGVTLPYGDYTAVITGDNYELSMMTATVNSPTQSKDGSITRKPESLSGYLYGVILDTTTQAPAHGITLTFRKGTNVTAGPVAATVTSAYGDYGVTLPYGDYTAVITGNNYEPSTMTATVNSPTQSRNGTIARIVAPPTGNPPSTSSPPSPPTTSNPPAPPVLLPGAWLTGNQPYVSWNPAVLTERDNGQTRIRLDPGPALSLIQNSNPETPICTFGADVPGTAIFEIPSSVAAAALDKGACANSILVLSQAGSFALPLSVLKSNGGLENGAVTRLTIEPVAASDDDRIRAAALKSRITLLPVPAVSYSLTIAKGGETKEVEDFGDVFVQRSMPIGPAPEPGPETPAPGVFLFDGKSESFLFAPTRFVSDDKAQLHAIVQRTSNSTYAAGYTDVLYSDIAEHWAESAIGKLAARGLLTALPEERFDPDGPITRAEFISLLVHALGLQHKKGAEIFRDMDPNDPLLNEVLIARQLGLAFGDREDFRPNGTITREEMAAITARALAYVRPEIQPAEAADLDAFQDSDEISAWAQEAVRIAVANGILVGDPAHRLAPADGATRAQAVSVLERLLRRLALID